MTAYLGKLLLCLGLALVALGAVAHPPPPPVAAQPEPPVALSAEDSKLFERFRPLVRQQVLAELRQVAADLENTDRLGAPVGGAFGSLLGAAIVSLVKKLLAATLAALVLAAVVSLLWAYWYYPVGFTAIWLATTALVSKAVAAREVRKVKP